MRKLLSLLTVSMVIFSCGGGGSSTSEETISVSQQETGITSQQSETPNTTVTSEPTTSQTYTLTGYAVDDYILNGTVKVYDIRTGELIANTTTTEKGKFEVNVPTNAEVLVKVEGGVLDPDGDPTTTDNQTPFNKTLATLAAPSLVQGDSKILVTPSSTAVVASALGVDSSSLMNNRIDPVQVIAQTQDKDKVVNTFKDGIEKLPEDLKPVVKEDTELQLKEEVIAKLVEKAGEPEKLAKELEDLKLDGDAGITETVLAEVKEEVENTVNAEVNQTSEVAETETPESSYYFVPSSSGSSTGSSVSTTAKTVTVRVVDDNDNPVSAASVTVRVLQSARADDTLQEIDRSSTQSDQGGYTNIQLEVPENGGIIEITVLKDGLAQTVKSIKFDSGAGVPQRIKIKAARVEYSQVADTSTTEFTRAGDKKLVFYVVKNKKTNTRSLRIGTPALSRDGSEEVTFKMEVPSDLYEGASKIRVDITNFDPSNKTDAEKMPSWVDANGNQLASVAFDYVKLTNLDTGEPLKRSVRADGDPVVVVREVKCSLLKGDNNTDEPGYQVPFYVLKDGVWEYLGEGVVVTDYEGSTIKDVNSVCQTNDYEYVKITITNPDFSNPYINLDYPLITDISNIVEKCANLRFVSSKDGTPITNLYVSLWDDDWPEDFYWSEGTTDSEGKVRIKTTYYDSDNTSDTTARIGYWNDYTSQWVETTVSLEDCESQEFSNVTVTVPSNLCYVQGKVSDESGNGIQTYVGAYASDWSYYKWGETDSQGLFSLQVPCGVDSYLEVKGERKEFNINGTINDDEVSDTGSAVTINFVVSNAAPYPWAWTDAPQFVNPDFIPVNVGVYDEEGDFPVTVRVEILDENNNPVSNSTSQIDKDSFDPHYGQSVINVPAPDSAGIYRINVNATDSKGNSRDLKEIMNKWGGQLPQIQIISGGNTNPPVLEYTYAFSQGKRIYTDISASDVDGDLAQCKVEVKAENGTLITPDTSFNDTQGSFCWGHYEFVASKAGNYTVIFNATDSSGNVASSNQTIYVEGDQPLQVFMWVDKVYNLEKGDVVFVNVHLEDDDSVNATGLTFTVNNDTIDTQCDFGNEPMMEKPTETCYFVDNWTWRDANLYFVVPDDNETSYEICVTGTINGENVNQCTTVYKSSIPTDATLQINIRR